MTAPAQLSDYATAVQRADILGHIAWYSLPDPHITAAEVKEHATTAGIKPDHLPAEPRLSDAFKRAVRKTDLMKTKYYAVPGSENRLSYMVRPVSMRSKELEAHLVLEELDAAGKRLSHQDLIAYRLNTETVFYDEKPLIDPMPFADFTRQRTESFRNHLARAMQDVDPQSIRYTIRQELWDMEALNVRSRGGIYFVPAHREKDMEALETFSALVGADFHTLPLPDTGKQKDMLIKAFEEDVHTQAFETIEALDKVLNSGAKIPPSVWARHKKRFDDLTTRTAQYSDIVDKELDKAGTELMMLQSKITAVLTGDYISEGRGKK